MGYKTKNTLNVKNAFKIIEIPPHNVRGNLNYSPRSRGSRGIIVIIIRGSGPPWQCHGGMDPHVPPQAKPGGGQGDPRLNIQEEEIFINIIFYITYYQIQTNTIII
jgi:hypothetical protein